MGSQAFSIPLPTPRSTLTAIAGIGMQCRSRGRLFRCQNLLQKRSASYFDRLTVFQSPYILKVLLVCLGLKGVNWDHLLRVD